MSRRPPTRPARLARRLVACALVLAACAPAPPAVTPPADDPRSPMPTASTPLDEVGFTPASWPESGSACEVRGYAGLLGRIEAVNARTVRFTLCAPDGAFPARLAHPALGILDTAVVDRLAADPGFARSITGTGPYRIDRWGPDDAIILVRARPKASAVSRTPTVILRWMADAGRRTDELQAATVDGIDAPGAPELDRIATLPEITTSPRAGLATAYLAFGAGAAFDDVRVRRAIAGALDRAALAGAAFPPGSSVPTHLVPCEIEGACTGQAWFAFNAPAAAANLAAASFDVTRTYSLHVPDRALPGLPDPQAAAAVVQAQLRAHLELDLAIVTHRVEDFTAAIETGRLDGLYLAGIATDLPAPEALLAPLFGEGVSSPAAARADGVRDALEAAARTGDPAERAAAFATAGDAIRASVPLVPLVHPGSMVAFRADVGDPAASPLGTDALGALTPGDRRQLVFMQASEPDGAWCGDQASADAFRLCSLVSEGLFGTAPGGLAIEPRLATRCTSGGDTRTWTCTLQRGVRYSDGARFDAGDVLATYVAAWDAGSPLRASRPAGDQGVVAQLFGALLPAGWDRP